MKAVIVGVTLAAACQVTAAAQPPEVTHKCLAGDNQLTYTDRPSDIGLRECVRITWSRSEMAVFQKTLAVGSRTRDGLVIEIKLPIAKVQTQTGERWFRVDELAPKY